MVRAHENTLSAGRLSVTGVYTMLRSLCYFFPMKETSCCVVEESGGVVTWARPLKENGVVGT